MCKDKTKVLFGQIKTQLLCIFILKNIIFEFCLLPLRYLDKQNI
nr:MAG TPA: hypothetical protein [Caudoviricetes sp.]